MSDKASRDEKGMAYQGQLNRLGGGNTAAEGALSLGKPHPAAAVSKGHEGRHECSERETGTQHREHESSSVPRRALINHKQGGETGGALGAPAERRRMS